MTWTGKIHYMSGGTTGTPKILSYSHEQWSKSISITKDVLRHHGVNEHSTIIVLAPFAPWAIGNVFTEAALHLGASVYPIGLYGEKQPFHFLFSTIKFTHHVGTARGLLSLFSKLNARQQSNFSSNCLSFVAGEQLDDETRMHCENVLQTKLINIYGLAEFDTVAAEFEQDLVLHPSFDYRIKTPNNRIDFLTEGTIGELLIKRKNESNFFETGDHIEVLSRTIIPWGQTFKITILGRCDENLTLKDGTNIDQAVVDKLYLEHPSLDRLQICVADEDNSIEIVILYKEKIGMDPIVKSDLKSSFINSSIDILDSHLHKIISSILVKRIDDVCDFNRTQRGKIPTLLKTNYESI